MKDKKVIYADISLFVIAIIWGSGFVVTKNALDHMTPFYILGFRFLFATLAMALVSVKQFKNATKFDLKAGIIVGFFMFLGFVFHTVGIKYTTAGVNAFIAASNVVLVPFMYWFASKKKPDNYEIFGAILCFFGIGILSIDSSFKIGYGEFLTFLCAISFAMQIVAVGFFAKDVNIYIFTTVQLGLVTLLSFLCAFIFEPGITGINTSALSSILYLAILVTMLGFFVQNTAQKHTSSTHAAIILSLEAVFGSILSIIFLKEVVTFKFIIGCFAILISVLASETKFEFLKKKNINEEGTKV